MYKYETKVCPKMWAYFALRAGWLKINVRTNLGPQIYMYLSALGIGHGKPGIVREFHPIK